MDCLNNYIGIKGCTDPDPESGLYINDLEGISLESVDKLANSEQLTYLGVWAEVQKRGLKKFSTKLTNYFRTKYRIKKLLDRYRFGRKVDTTEIAPAALNIIRGISIKLNPSSDAEFSPFITLNLSNIQFFTQDAGDVEFQIFNSDTGEKLWEKTITLITGGANEIFASFTVPALTFPRELVLIYKADAINTPKTTLGDNTGGGCGCGCSIGNCCSAELRGIEYNTATEETTYSDENSFGFRGFVSLQCSYDGLVCASRDLFAVALWYFLGAEMMRERINSPRLNKYTTVNKAGAEKLLEDFTEVYENEMETAADAIDLDSENCCIECSAVIQYVETLL